MSEEAEAYDRVHAILSDARKLSGRELTRYLDETCGRDVELRASVQRLLTAGSDERANDLFSEEQLGSLPRELAGWLPPSIGAYTVLGKIGQGGMGVVYEAEQAAPRRKVAIKLLHPMTATAESLRRFRREAQLLGRLQHPGIAQIIEASTHDLGRGAQPFFAMELVDGLPLTDYADANALDVRARLALIAQLCDVLEYAHVKGVIHRDIKPANILVTTEEASGRGRAIDTENASHARLKILDFGIARATDSDLTAATLQTSEGQLVGTISYMSPEQASGDPEAIDERSDVFAVGVLAYELLAGHLPLRTQGMLLHEAVRVVREDEPSSLGTLDRTLRGDVETIVAKALEKEKERRYRSAAEMAADIRRFLSNQPIAARPPSAIYQLGKFARRNKALVGGVLATLVVALVGAGISIAFAVDANRRSEELSRVVDYQSSQLAGIDVPRMGDGLRAALMDEARAAWERAGVQGAQLDERAGELEQLLNGLNFVDLSLYTLNENIFTRAQRTLAQQFQDQPLVEARLLTTLATTMKTLGLLAPANDSYARALAIHRRELGDEHLDTLASVAELGWLLALRMEWGEAEQLLREAYDVRSRLLSADHPDTYNAHRCLTFVLANAGPERREEYLRMQAWQCDWLERDLGSDHLDVITNRAALLRDQGRLEEAEPLFRRHLDVLRERHDTDSLALLVPIRNFSEFLLRMGKLEESEALIRESLEGTRRLLGEDHRLTVGAMSILGMALHRQGKVSEAEPYLAAAQSHEDTGDARAP